MTPRQWQLVLVAMIGFLGVLAQALLAAIVPVPGPAAALCPVLVIAIGMACGPSTGAITGFSVGLALDVIPPALGLIGVQALTLLLLGALAGQVRDPRGLAPIQVAALTGALTLLGGLVQTLLDWVLNVGTARPAALLLCALTASVLGVVLVPMVSAVLRRSRSRRRRRIAV